MAEDKKRYIGAGLSEEVYYSLIKMSTWSGRHPTNLVEEYVQRGILQDIEMHQSENKELPVALQVFKHLQDLKVQSNTYIMLKQIASSLLSSPDEQMADHLHSLCESAGVSFDQVMKETQENSLEVRSAISFDDDKGIAYAKSFLMDCFRNQVEIRANDIYSLGLEKGFSAPILRQAKIDLGIMSVRRSKAWMWTMPSSLTIPSMVEVKHNGN